jgi:hypothetical protein
VSAGPVIRASDRILIAGFTGSGKSEWMYAHARLLRSQILILDSKGDDLWPGAENVYSVRELRKALTRSRVIRFDIDDDEDKELVEEIFDIAWQVRGLTIIVHDGIGITSSGYCPKSLRKILTKGRSKGTRTWIGVQSPVGFAPVLKRQADHILIAAQRWTTSELANLTNEFGFDSPRQLRDTLDDLRTQYGERGRYAYLHLTRADGKLYLRPPMPDWMRRR